MQIRTEVAASTQAANGKWRSCFNTFVGTPGQEILANTISSPPIWGTEDEANEQAGFALQTLESTGKFPNMCVRW